MLDPAAPGATHLARLVAAGDVSSFDLVSLYVARLDAAGTLTNCVAARDAERALTTARARDDAQAAGTSLGPLHGVPFTVKDWIDAEGLPCTGGWAASATRVPARDATAVARLRAAGGVLLAKTTVQPETELFGIVRNPHDPTRSPGGSSSGEAVAVASGASPLGLGSDSGGSIRLPAAWCGAPGLKPTTNCVPTTGHFPRVGERGDGRTVIGPLAPRVDDLLLALRIVAGPDRLDTAVPPVDLDAQPCRPLEELRVAAGAIDGRWSCTSAMTDAVDAVVGVLAGAGATVAPPVPLRLDEAYDITRGYWSRAERTGADAQQQLDAWDRYRRRAARDTADVDVIVAPAARDVAPPHRAMEPDDYGFTVGPSLTGAPAVVIPVARSGALPIAVQMIGHPWRDVELLGVAAAVEARMG